MKKVLVPVSIFLMGVSFITGCSGIDEAGKKVIALNNQELLTNLQSPAKNGLGSDFICQNVTITAYYRSSLAPTEEEKILQGTGVNRFKGIVYTLQQYIEGQSSYVTIAMDTPFSDHLKPLAMQGLSTKGQGVRVRIPELERRFTNGKPIIFRVEDTGNSFWYNVDHYKDSGGNVPLKVDIAVETPDQANNGIGTINNVTIEFIDQDMTCGGVKVK
jgi:hypothetical protein